MKTIWKYQLQVRDGNITAQIPHEAEILTVQAQGPDPNIVTLWAVVDDGVSGLGVCRTFRIFGTGHPIEQRDHLTYLGTVQFCGGALVWHVFEVTL